MKTKLFVIGSNLLLFLLAGCYPQGPEYAEDTDIVYTTYDDKYDFDAGNTFAMPDQIVTDVKIEDGETTYVYMKPAFATPILQAIKKNMEAKGWQQVGLAANPNVILTPAGLSSTTYFYSYWYDWWYGGWYGGYWGWYYPPYYTVSSYTTGTLIMVISDPNQAANSPIDRSPAVWVGAANGLASYSYNVTRVTNAIDKAFAQSPYLETK
jgi:hypothetical protein